MIAIVYREYKIVAELDSNKPCSTFTFLGENRDHFAKLGFGDVFLALESTQKLTSMFLACRCWIFFLFSLRVFI